MLEALMPYISGIILFALRIYPGDKFPNTLTPEEEASLLDRTYNGDISARNELVEHNMRLVAHIIKKYYTHTDESEDLISIGTIGLIKGINTYRQDKSVRLATYASRCIENEILMYFRNKKKYLSDISLSDSIDNEDESRELSYIDILSESEDPFEKINNTVIYESLKDAIKTELTDIEARILIMRYGLYGGICLTQRETAEKCCISRSYVSRLEKKALLKLKKILDRQ